MIQTLRACTVVIAGGLALASLSAPTSAAVIVFSGSDEGAGEVDPRPGSDAAAAAFDLALGTFGLITFESDPLGPFASLTVAPGVTLTGTDYFGENQTILNSPVAAPELYGYNTTAAGSQFASAFGGSFTFTFETKILAFGLYVSGLQGGPSTISFNDGLPQVVNIPIIDGGIAFVGFIDPGARISRIQIEFGGDNVAIDDARYGANNAPVPEPGTLALIGSGLAGLAVRRRRSS